MCAEAVWVQIPGGGRVVPTPSWSVGGRGFPVSEVASAGESTARQPSKRLDTMVCPRPVRVMEADKLRLLNENNGNELLEF